MKQRYKQTGKLDSQLLLQLLFASQDDDKRRAIQFMDQTIFHIFHTEWMKNIVETVVEPLLKRESDKPFLLFHLYGWQLGGDSRVISSITQVLSKHYKVAICIFGDKPRICYPTHPETLFISLHGDENRYDRLLLLIKLLAPDIFIGNNNNLPELVKIYRDLRSAGIRTIAYNHEYYFFPHKHEYLFKGALDRDTVFEQVSAVCFLTSISAQAYGLKHKNAVLMPNPNTFEIETEDSFNPHGVTIVAVGRFDDPIKRLDRLLCTFKLVLEQLPSAQLIVVGRYNLAARIPHHTSERISDLLARLEISEANLKFVGEKRDVRAYYRKADVLVSTSENEGFGMVLTEAGAFGLPVVMFSIPGLEDIIHEGVNGFIVPQGDLQAMSEKIIQLLSDNMLRKNMSKQAKQLVQRYSLSLIEERWKKLIELLLSSKADSQETLQRELANQFMTPVPDELNFLKIITKEYEFFAQKMVDYNPDQVVSNGSVSLFEKFAMYVKKAGFRVALVMALKKVFRVLRQKMAYLLSMLKRD